MKDYYKILRISRLANAAEIKRAYRRLAVVFHPDKNQSPESSSLFQEINEAHEVLSDPVKRGLYDQLLAGGSAPVDRPPPQQWHRDPAYRKRQQTGYRPKPAQPSERLLLMAHLLRYYRMICLIGVGWCAFLVVDYVLPFKRSVEKVIPSYEAKVPMQRHSSAHVIFTDKQHQFPVSNQGIGYFPNGAKAIVVTSRLLNVIVRVDSEWEEYSITTLLSVYQVFVFWPVILLGLSVVGLRLKNGIEFRFSMMVVICIFLLFNLIFLTVSIL